MNVSVRFPHGLGDCVYFAHALPLYVKRGYDVTVACNPDKQILFEASGVDCVRDDEVYPTVSWNDAAHLNDLVCSSYAACNKAATNLSRAPMPSIGTPKELWSELISTSLDLRPYIGKTAWEEVDSFLDALPHPIILIHTKGNSFQNTKSLDDQFTLDLYRELLHTTNATLVLLDWDDRVQKLNSYRVRHLTDHWKRIGTETLLALIYRADLLIGIDSGPFHLARYTSTPSLGIFNHQDHYPIRYTLPRSQQLCLVPSNGTANWNTYARLAYNIVECEGDKVTACFAARYAKAMLSPTHYFKDQHLAADVQMYQQFVSDFERGYGSLLTQNVDRNKSFDLLLKLMAKRFDKPVIVETGCIRHPEDWRGAGYSTYLLGAYVERAGGELHSVDLSPENCSFAQHATSELTRVIVSTNDSIEFLRTFEKSIDVLFLDSMDTEHPAHADHAFKELAAALPCLHSGSLILIDDTVHTADGWKGKGEKVVPWLLEKGWRLLYSNYQALLG